MLVNLYSIRDRKAGFLVPTHDINDETAQRNFAYAIQRADSMYLAFPDDYDLYYVGQYDTDSGEIAGCIPRHVCSARSCLSVSDAGTWVPQEVQKDV